MPESKAAPKVALGKAPLPAAVPVLSASNGDQLTIEVDVDNIVVPYTVIFDDRTLIFGATDRRERVSLVTGFHRLTWSFTHLEKDWTHKITAQIGAAGAQVLDDKAEANKDAPYSIGWAVIDVA